MQVDCGGGGQPSKASHEARREFEKELALCVETQQDKKSASKASNCNCNGPLTVTVTVRESIITVTVTVRESIHHRRAHKKATTTHSILYTLKHCTRSSALTVRTASRTPCENPHTNSQHTHTPALCKR